jgi:hypothetical protein
MSDPDEALKKFESIYGQFKLFCEHRGLISEADTRVKLIDQVLKEVLEWPEFLLSREDHTGGEKAGFTDYQLRIGDKAYVAVEAKREGTSFELPEASGRRRLKMSGIIQTAKAAKEAINQVRQYCVDDSTIKYAIATNGFSWIIFKTLQPEGSWKDGYAIIFYSANDIKTNFIEFWKLLSFDAINKGSLEDQFAVVSYSKRGQYRVLDKLYNADLPLERNRLHAQLHPVIDAFFLDIADKAQLEILESCYVYSRSVRSATFDLDNVIKDYIPLFLKKEGTAQIYTGRQDSGIFDEAMKSAIEKNIGQLYLLLGGIGSGKTTFSKRYLRITGKDILEKDAIWFYISLLGPPAEPHQIEGMIYSSLLEEIRSRYPETIKETRKTLKRIYKKELDLLYESSLKSENLDPNEYEKRISPYLEEWKNNTVDYVKRLLKYCRERDRAIFIFIDNVDQLPPVFQERLFLLAQKLTRDADSLTVLSMREESYHTASTQKILTAYTSRKFHIASPRFRKLIEYRLNYATKVLMRSDEEIKLILRSGITLDKKAIIEFLNIIQSSIFVKSKWIAHFVEAICYGNMRLALDMFNTFLVSGATDVDKMLRIFHREEEYQVAFHEFVKSVMLKDRMYYKETIDNPVMNIFDCGTERHSSHFTALRLLKFLKIHDREYSSMERGFIEWNKVLYEFENSFDNVDDLIKTTERLVRWRLLEVNTKSQETLKGATHIRITGAGDYYLKYLVNKFCYLDLVLQDTPLDSEALRDELAAYMKKVDNLTGRDDDKYQRTLVRFERVDLFLEYLLEQEEKEMGQNKMPVNPVFLDLVVPTIIEGYSRDKDFIIKRYEENRTRFNELYAEAEEGLTTPSLFGVYDSDEDDGSATK